MRSTDAWFGITVRLCSLILERPWSLLIVRRGVDLNDLVPTIAIYEYDEIMVSASNPFCAASQSNTWMLSACVVSVVHRVLFTRDRSN